MGKVREKTASPGTPMSQWVRDAAEVAGMTYQALADALTREGVGAYDRSIVQKMTTRRKVSAIEAAAISRITGHPLPDQGGADGFAAGFAKLDPENRRVVEGMLEALLRAQAGE